MLSSNIFPFSHRSYFSLLHILQYEFHINFPRDDLWQIQGGTLDAQQKQRASQRTWFLSLSLFWFAPRVFYTTEWSTVHQLNGKRKKYPYAQVQGCEADLPCHPHILPLRFAQNSNTVFCSLSEFLRRISKRERVRER